MVPASNSQHSAWREAIILWMEARWGCIFCIVSCLQCPHQKALHPQGYLPSALPWWAPLDTSLLHSLLPPLSGAASPQARVCSSPFRNGEGKKYDFKSSRGGFLFLYFRWACQTPTCSLKVRTLAGSAGEPMHCRASALGQNFSSCCCKTVSLVPSPALLHWLSG